MVEKDTLVIRWRVHSNMNSVFSFAQRMVLTHTVIWTAKAGQFPEIQNLLICHAPRHLLNFRNTWYKIYCFRQLSLKIFNSFIGNWNHTFSHTSPTSFIKVYKSLTSCPIFTRRSAAFFTLPPTPSAGPFP